MTKYFVGNELLQLPARSNNTKPECENFKALSEEALRKVRLQPFHNLWMKTRGVSRDINRTWVPIHQRK